jgi:hypothetical protein
MGELLPCDNPKRALISASSGSSEGLGERIMWVGILRWEGCERIESETMGKVKG